MATRKRMWVSPEFETVEIPEFDISPVGQNLLDAYRAGWVSVSLDQRPAIEGQAKYVRRYAGVIANIIQENYDLRAFGGPEDFNELLKPEYATFFPVTVRQYDERGRPAGVFSVPLREFAVERIPVGGFRRPGQIRIHEYRRWY